MKFNTIRKAFIILLIAIISCKKENDNDSHSDFEELWHVTDNYYPFFEFKKINWDSIYAVYQPQFININENVRITLLGNMLNELKDGHANLLRENGSYLSSYSPPRSLKDQNSFSLNVVYKYFSKDLNKLTSTFQYGILPDELGYIYISSFPKDEETYRHFDAVLDHIKETKGLIIDIRHNGGGSTNASDYFIERLISDHLEGTLWTRTDGGYRPVRQYYPGGDFQYTKSTVLLINGKSFSTAEAMANLCKKIEHITLIGDTTGGGGGVPQKFYLPSGLRFRVPTRYALRYDGEHVEWNGIPPDILVPQTKEDIDNEQDKQLEYAIDYLNNK